MTTSRTLAPFFIVAVLPPGLPAYAQTHGGHAGDPAHSTVDNLVDAVAVQTRLPER